jgi:hypothetical protein
VYLSLLATDRASDTFPGETVFVRTARIAGFTADAAFRDSAQYGYHQIHGALATRGFEAGVFTIGGAAWVIYSLIVWAEFE